MKKEKNTMPQWLQDELNNIELKNTVEEREFLAWMISDIDYK